MTTIGEELKKCRNHMRMTLHEMAARLKVSTTTIVNYETGKRMPELDFLIDFAGVCEKDFLYWLGLRIAESKSALTGQAKAMLDKAVASAVVQAGQSFVSLPLYDLSELAHPGTAPVHVHGTDELPQFSRAWLERELDATPADLCLVTVNDDSMTPTLRPGDIVLLDRRIARPDREGVYVVRMNGIALMKRLQILPGEVIKVVSENPAYETFTINQSDLNGSDISILGRVAWVIWAGRKI